MEKSYASSSLISEERVTLSIISLMVDRHENIFSQSLAACTQWLIINAVTMVFIYSDDTALNCCQDNLRNFKHGTILKFER